METVPQRERVHLTPEAMAVGPELDELGPYAGPPELEFTLPAWEEKTRPALEIMGASNAAVELRLDAYLSELMAEAASLPAQAYAPHPAINAVLTTMLARAQKQGIEAERRVDVPETLPFPDTELCAVLMNLLQNALDANALVPEGARKWLRVDCHVRGVHLYIGVENACFAPVD